MMEFSAEAKVAPCLAYSSSLVVCCGQALIVAGNLADGHTESFD